MKTPRILKVSLYLRLLLGFSACSVPIPQTDNTPPKFTLEIQGGFPEGPIRLSSDEDLSGVQINLLKHTTYPFILAGTDAGGMYAMGFRIGWPLRFANVHPPEATVITNGEAHRILEWEGDRADPKNAVIIQGKIVTSLYNNGIDYGFRALIRAFDFGGGTNSSNNSTLREINFLITDESQPIGLIRR